MTVLVVYDVLPILLTFEVLFCFSLSLSSLDRTKLELSHRRLSTLRDVMFSSMIAYSCDSFAVYPEERVTLPAATSTYRLLQLAQAVTSQVLRGYEAQDRLYSGSQPRKYSTQQELRLFSYDRSANATEHDGEIKGSLLL